MTTHPTRKIGRFFFQSQSQGVLWSFGDANFGRQSFLPLGVSRCPGTQELALQTEEKGWHLGAARSAVQKKRFQMEVKRMLKTVILWKCDQKRRLKESERYENYER